MKFYNGTEYLRQQSYPIFWALKLTSSAIRSLVTPLFCLSAEMKRIPIMATSLSGYLRLTWWRTQIEMSPPPKDSHPLLKYLTALPQDQMIAFINSYEQLLEEIPFTEIQGIISFAEQSDIHLLKIAHTLITKKLPTETELQIIKQAGLCMTCCYLIQHLKQLNAKDHHFSTILNTKLLTLLQSSVPQKYTLTTRWLAPLNGYYKTIISAYSHSQKPQLFIVQWKMLGSYIYHFLSFLRS